MNSSEYTSSYNISFLVSRVQMDSNVLRCDAVAVVEEEKPLVTIK